MNNDYQTTPEDINLTEAQQKEILKRDADFVSGKTTARDWEDIRRELEALYNE
jgi:putative addiction module component (TIGR02574 family)